MTYRHLLFEREDGSQLLIELWPGERAILSERADTDAIWSSPIEAIVDETRERVTTG